MSKFLLDDETCTFEQDDGDVITANPEIVARLYYNTKGANLGLLPPAVRWVSSDGLGLILERPPQDLEIQTFKGKQAAKTGWTIWGIRLESDLKQVQSSDVFTISHTLTTGKDKLYYLPLPGIKRENNGLPHLSGLSSEGLSNRLLASVNSFWKNLEPTIDELLDEQYMPPEWWDIYSDKGLKGYLSFLSKLSVEALSFAPYVQSHMPTLNDLTDSLSKGSVNQHTTPMDVLGDLVAKARDSSDE